MPAPPRRPRGTTPAPPASRPRGTAAPTRPAAWARPGGRRGRSPGRRRCSRWRSWSPPAGPAPPRRPPPPARPRRRPAQPHRRCPPAPVRPPPAASGAVPRQPQSPSGHPGAGSRAPRRAPPNRRRIAAESPPDRIDRRPGRQRGHHRPVPTRTAAELTAYLYLVPDRSGRDGEGRTVVEYVDDESIRIRSTAGDGHLRPGRPSRVRRSPRWSARRPGSSPWHSSTPATTPSRPPCRCSSCSARRPARWWPRGACCAWASGSRWSTCWCARRRRPRTATVADDTDLPVAQATVTYAPI